MGLYNRFCKRFFAAVIIRLTAQSDSRAPLVANPKKLLHMVANPARGLLDREKRTKEKVWHHTPPPTPTEVIDSVGLRPRYFVANVV